MNTTRKPFTTAALLLFASLALAAPAAAGQMDERTKRDTGLVYDSLEAILKGLRTYDFAAGVGAPLALRSYVFEHKDNPQARQAIEAALLEFVQASPAPAPGGLMAACRALGLIGGDASVPVLGALLLRPETTDPARYALERIPGQGADQALLAALDKTQGEVKRGVVFSLGARRTAAAVPALARLAGGRDFALATDAVKALGRIGGSGAVQALTPILGKSGAALRSETASALLLAAEGLKASGDAAEAASVHEKLMAANLPTAVRQAAFKGKLAGSGSAAKDLILKALTGKDAALYAPAVALVPPNFGPGEIGRAADLLEGLPEDARIQLTAVLGGYPADAVRPYLLAAAEGPSLNVRLAALRAIERTGDAKAVAFLAAKAARAAGAEQEAARETLARLKGIEVDAAILGHLAKTSDEAIKGELVQAASARRVEGVKPALMDLVKTGPPTLRTRAAAALRNIAGTADIPALLGLLLALEDETARESMQDTVAAVARTNPRPLLRGNVAEAMLAEEKDPKKKVDLLRVLGKTGDDTALALVRRALADPDEAVADAAVRALADWPSATARDDVTEVARTSLNLNHRVLAVRALVRMIGLEPYRAPEGAASDLLNVLALTPRPEEKKLVLGMLVRFPCVKALKTAESLLSDQSVAAEAKLAADRIRQVLGAR